MATIKAQASDYSAVDLIKSIHEYFMLPMTMADKVLAVFLVFGITTLIIVIGVAAIKHIWNGDKPSDKRLL